MKCLLRREIVPGRDAEDVMRELLLSAGIALNGSNPWDIRVNNDNFYERVFSIMNKRPYAIVEIRRFSLFEILFSWRKTGYSCV